MSIHSLEVSFFQHDQVSYSVGTVVPTLTHLIVFVSLCILNVLYLSDLSWGCAILPGRIELLKLFDFLSYTKPEFLLVPTLI